MTKYRHALPQMGGKIFLSDAGIETTLIFHEGLELPCFAAFTLLKETEGKRALSDYYRRHAAIARANRLGFVLESATWRASSDWGDKLGYSPDQLDAANRQAIEMLHDLREEFETDQAPMVISGCVGPRGDGYDPGTVMGSDEAQAYHTRQIDSFELANVDLATAITMTNSSEAVGVTRAAQAASLPVVISFTVETDGRLPTGQSLGDAISQVDAATGTGPAYYMINCAHPEHFENVLEGEWTRRLRGIRANASRCSHAELDEATELDDGDPMELSRQYGALRERLPHLTVFGGCCGTDHRHIEQIASACSVAA